MRFRGCKTSQLQSSTRWAPTSYKWSCNPYKWPYKWVTGVITPISGVITILITGRGPTLYSCNSHSSLGGHVLLAPKAATSFPTVSWPGIPLLPKVLASHSIHGTNGIFTYMKTHKKINHSCREIYQLHGWHRYWNKKILKEFH